MIPFPSNVRVWLATGRTDMRRGMQGLSLLVQEGLERDPHAGDVFVFRGPRGNWTLLKTSPFLPCRDSLQITRRGIDGQRTGLLRCR